jgi:hypothetical protein
MADIMGDQPLLLNGSPCHPGWMIFFLNFYGGRDVVLMILGRGTELSTTLMNGANG